MSIQHAASLQTITEVRILIIDKNTEVAVGRMNNKPFHSEPILSRSGDLIYTPHGCYRIKRNSDNH